MTVEKLREAGYVHWHSTGHRMKLDQARLLRGWQMAEGMTGMHCETGTHAHGESQVYLEDWVGRLSLLLRSGWKAARDRRGASRRPSPAVESQVHYVAQRECLALRRQVVVEAMKLEMDEETRPGMIDGPFVAQGGPLRLELPPPMPAVAWRPAPPLTHQMLVLQSRQQALLLLPPPAVQGLSHWGPRPP